MADKEHVITGRVADWIRLLRDLIPTYGPYSAILLLSPHPDQGTEALEHAIRSVEVDEDGAEVNLCAEPLNGTPFTVAQVLAELERLPDSQRSYLLYSASPLYPFPDGIDVREDAPIVDILADPDDRRVAFVAAGATPESEARPA